MNVLPLKTQVLVAENKKEDTTNKANDIRNKISDARNKIMIPKPQEPIESISEPEINFA